LSKCRQATRSAALALAGLAVATFATRAATTEDVTFRSGDVELAATILLPDGPGPHPGAVLVHGSGASDRSNPWTSAWAEELVSRGIAVLHPDKRGAGDSGGDWMKASLRDLAGDAIAAARFLGARPDVDPTHVGLIGFSQGGQVVPLAAESDERVAFAVDVSGSVIPLFEQVGDEVLLSAERDGIEGEGLDLVARIHEASVRYIRTGEGWDEYRTAIRNAEQSGLAGTGTVERFPTDPSDPIWEHVRMLGEIDPIDSWKRLAAPVLFVYGGRDERIRVPKSVARIQAELGPAGVNYTLLVCGPNGHAHVRADQLDLIATWIRDRGEP
jgi:dipeptidyl aminopeptidase/acylaminoacyl peptidase